MQILLDSDPCEMKAQTVGEAIAAAAALAQTQGRLIIDVIVDGLRWSEQQLDSAEQNDTTAETVEFITAEPKELVLQTFEDAADALSDADALQKEAAELLQSDQSIICMDKLAEALSIWLTVQQAIVKGSQVVELQLDSISVKKVPITESIARLNENLQLLRSALQQDDQVAVADALLYEFPDIINEWRTILEHLQSLVEREMTG
ncbi:MAG: hypothetical protein IH984_01150 [Planctomycetes bacterium]|nr:hypothetical protein [Planctomycetota bacterium]